MLNHITTYKEFSVAEYLKTFEKEFQKKFNLEILTSYLSSNNNYYTEKPYLYRRIINSLDERFESFEIVHDKSERISAVVFNVNIQLSELQNIFEMDCIQHEPYSNSTAFIFKSINPDIETIKTRYPEWLTKLKDSEYEFAVDGTSDIVVNPKFSFLQFNIK